MLVEDLIEKEFYSVESSMSFKQVFNVFNDSKQNELPIVDNAVLHGIIIREQMLGKEENNDPISTIKDQFRDVSVKEDERIIVALKKMTLGGISNLPVINSEGIIKGIVSASALWNEFSIKSSMSGIGGWIVLSMNKNDFKLSEIAQIVESNGMLIVMHFVHFFQEMDIIDVHIKVSRENVNELVQTFQRYGYKVVDVIQPQKFADDWDNRFDELMRFFST